MSETGKQRGSKQDLSITSATWPQWLKDLILNSTSWRSHHLPQGHSENPASTHEPLEDILNENCCVQEVCWMKIFSTSALSRSPTKDHITSDLVTGDNNFSKTSKSKVKQSVTYFQHGLKLQTQRETTEWADRCKCMFAWAVHMFTNWWPAVSPSPYSKPCMFFFGQLSFYMCRKNAASRLFYTSSNSEYICFKLPSYCYSVDTEFPKVQASQVRKQ